MNIFDHGLIPLDRCIEPSRRNRPKNESRHLLSHAYGFSGTDSVPVRDPLPIGYTEHLEAPVLHIVVLRFVYFVQLLAHETRTISEVNNSQYVQSGAPHAASPIALNVWRSKFGSLGFNVGW